MRVREARRKGGLSPPFSLPLPIAKPLTKPVPGWVLDVGFVPVNWNVQPEQLRTGLQEFPIMFRVVPIPPSLGSPRYEINREAVLVRRLPWPGKGNWWSHVTQFHLLDRGSVTLERTKMCPRFLVRMRLFEVSGQLPEGVTCQWMQVTKDAWGYDAFSHCWNSIVQEERRAGRANLISLAQLTPVR